ncbi:hypothetical protein BDV95DRAFT_317499 [Massariosphaeria phaeospora]|uniref:Uncharacterized protein n=1 Tax=Massariosphaeria phaeospora TaxID=100035 RepID=A0A7C8IE20_9PLEO|nr:hypothetical protein BDV95DRAFT_317499 [Massariosphaeria phaeospora]
MQTPVSYARTHTAPNRIFNSICRLDLLATFLLFRSCAIRQLWTGSVELATPTCTTTHCVPIPGPRLTVTFSYVLNNRTLEPGPCLLRHSKNIQPPEIEPTLMMSHLLPKQTYLSGSTPLLRKQRCLAAKPLTAIPKPQIAPDEANKRPRSLRAHTAHTQAQNVHKLSPTQRLKVKEFLKVRNDDDYEHVNDNDDDRRLGDLEPVGVQICGTEELDFRVEKNGSMDRRFLNTLEMRATAELGTPEKPQQSQQAYPFILVITLKEAQGNFGFVEDPTTDILPMFKSFSITPDRKRFTWFDHYDLGSPPAKKSRSQDPRKRKSLDETVASLDEESPIKRRNTGLL